MVFSFYGNYFFLLKEVEEGASFVKSKVSLKQFVEKKP